MTDTPPTPTINPDFDAFQRQEDNRNWLAREALPANKIAVFDALAAASVSIVIVRFDGCGDSGQIEDVEIQPPNSADPRAIEIARPRNDGSGLERSTVSVCDAIETLAYAFLEETHDGWENNDGAYGEFTFDVAKRTITLEYNERFMQSESFEHSF